MKLLPKRFGTYLLALEALLASIQQRKTPRTHKRALNIFVDNGWIMYQKKSDSSARIVQSSVQQSQILARDDGIML